MTCVGISSSASYEGPPLQALLLQEVRRVSLEVTVGVRAELRLNGEEPATVRERVVILDLCTASSTRFRVFQSGFSRWDTRAVTAEVMNDAVGQVHCATADFYLLIRSISLVLLSALVYCGVFRLGA
jgi:hypothetical protein